MFLYVILALCVATSNAYKNGAPSDACTTMIPGHGVPPQTDVSRFSLMPSKSTVSAGEVISITFKGFNANMTFEGFLIMAKDPKTNHAIGEFIVDTSDVEKSKAIDCHSNRKSALTHKDAGRKKEILAKWKAPSNLANNTEFSFYFTVVHGFKTFWVNEHSTPVKYMSGARSLTAQALTIISGLICARFLVHAY